MYLKFNFYNQSNVLNEYYLITSQTAINKHLIFDKVATITEKSNYAINLNIKIE